MHKRGGFYSLENECITEEAVGNSIAGEDAGNAKDNDITLAFFIQGNYNKIEE